MPKYCNSTRETTNVEARDTYGDGDVVTCLIWTGLVPQFADHPETSVLCRTAEVGQTVAVVENEGV